MRPFPVLPLTLLASIGLGVAMLDAPQPKGQHPVSFAAATSSPRAVPVDAEDDAVNRVIAISIDALNPGALVKLAEELPNFARLKREGASTLQARTLFEQTNTLPNHTAMVTSLRVKNGTNVTFNSDNQGTVHQTAGRYVPSIFDAVHDAGLRTGLYTVKDKFNFLARSYDAAHGAPDGIGANNGTAKIDRYVYREGEEAAVVSAFLADLNANLPQFTLVHLAETDRVGHAVGGMTPAYLDAVRRADAYLGQILDALNAKPALKRETLVLLTADHGTRSTSHHDPTVLANYRIPFFALGPGVPAGGNLYSLNPERAFPGRGRPNYRDTQPIRNADLGNLVADELDLPAIAGSSSNAKQTLKLR